MHVPRLNRRALLAALAVAVLTSTLVAGPAAAAPPDYAAVTVVLADPKGEVFAAPGNPATGWGSWSSVSEGSTMPGAPVTAVVTGEDEDQVTLFLADPKGDVFTASGSPSTGWGPWSSVSEGVTTPGAPITAVVTGRDRISLFLADPLGGVFTASGNPETGWGPWSSVSGGVTTPGAPISAVVTGKDEVTLFLADIEGYVYTTSGRPGSRWGPWKSVSEGHTTPGAPVTAVVNTTTFVVDTDGDGRFDNSASDTVVTLFLADIEGYVYSASGWPSSGWGPWKSVSEGHTTPGAPVTAVITGVIETGEPYTLVYADEMTLFLADFGGWVYTASGSAWTGWGPWKSVSEGHTTPGAPISAVVAV